MKIWKLILHKKLTGRENMAFDARQLELAAYDDFQPSLRFFDWARPTLTIGYGQKRTDVDLNKVKAAGLDYAVRPTGGRAVLHWDEVTYSVVLPARHPIAGESVLESYRILSEALVKGLRKIGVSAELTRGESGGHKNPSCFSSASRYEVAVSGRKIVGSAQRRKNGAILQQGSIPVGPEFRRLTEFLIDPPEENELLSKATCISECADFRIDKAKLVEALISGFEDVLGVEFDRE